jgi:membrane peptidoglycan carboxypeptidase
MINDEEYNQAIQTPPVFRTRDTASRPKEAAASQDSTPLPCHLRLLQDYLIATYGEAKLAGGDVRLKTTLDLPMQKMLEASAAKAEIPTNPNSPVYFLAVKEGESTRGLICVETGEQGLKILKGLEQPILAAKDFIFSVEKLSTFRWESLFFVHSAA